MKKYLKTAEEAIFEFRRLIELNAGDYELGRVFARLEEGSSPEEVERFRELLQQDIRNMKEWLYEKSLKKATERRN